MNRKQLIKKYIDFFKSKDHKEIKNSSLVPENDPTVLFTTAGMHPLVPFLLGESHPQGKKLTNVQRCVRTGDIDEVGNARHHTFFEMLGNWSLGDYWKKEAIELSFEFATKILGFSMERIAVTVFAGNKDAPRDTEAAEIWESLGVPKERIVFLEDNWWGPAGETGPCGPDTELFYWMPNDKPAPKDFDSNDEENWVEIWNDVLMQYNKNKKGKYVEAPQKNIDNGRGLERILAVVNRVEDNYLTDCWQPIIKKIEKLSGQDYNNDNLRNYIRIVADHIKAAVFMIADGVVPSNTEQGYVLRRLIRRAVRYCHVLGLKESTGKIAEPVFKIYDDYEILEKNKKKIIEELEKEEARFEKILEEGLAKAKKIFSKKISIDKERMMKLRTAGGKTVEKVKEVLENKKKGKKYALDKFKISEKEIDDSLITKEEAFYLYQSFGFPKSMMLDFAIERDLLIDSAGFKKELKKHQELSRTASAGKFKSGLADNSEATAKLHTATHLLNQALRVVLEKPDLHQRGSNITSERLRFDFNFDRKLTPEEKQAVEDLVNKKIQEAIPVTMEELSVDEAKKAGAQGIFDDKYEEKVKVYTIGDFSKEICAGPHVANTSELGKFKIKKEGSSSAGVRRIKGILE